MIRAVVQVPSADYSVLRADLAVFLSTEGSKGPRKSPHGSLESKLLYLLWVRAAKEGGQVVYTAGSTKQPNGSWPGGT